MGGGTTGAAHALIELVCILNVVVMHKEVHVKITEVQNTHSHTHTGMSRMKTGKAK